MTPHHTRGALLPPPQQPKGLQRCWKGVDEGHGPAHRAPGFAGTQPGRGCRRAAARRAPSSGRTCGAGTAVPSPRAWLPGRWGWDAWHGAHLCQPVRTMPWKRSGAKRGMACITRSQLSWFLTWWFRGGQACAGPVVPLKALANHTASKPLSAYLVRNCPAAPGSGVTLVAQWCGVAQGGQGPPAARGCSAQSRSLCTGGLLGAGRKVGASMAQVGGKHHP